MPFQLGLGLNMNPMSNSDMPNPLTDHDYTQTEGFVTPRKVRKRKNSSASSVTPTPVSNRYDVLTDNDPEMDSSSNQEPAIKIPPIYLLSSNVQNYQKILSDLQSIVKKEFTTENKGNKTKLNLTDINDFRSITQFYDRNHIQYYTFKLPQDDDLTVVIRNLPCSLTTSEIQEELTNLTFKIKSVTRLLNREKKAMPLCSVTLENDDNSKEIFNLSKLFYSIVQVEPRRKSKEIPQCTRCQRYGHTKNFCNLTPRCVKCTESHHYSVCTKQKTDTPVCVNCNESHPANYRGCAFYKNLKIKINANQQKPNHKFQNLPRHNITSTRPTLNSQENIPAIPPTTNHARSNITYANITSGNNRPTHDTSRPRPQPDIESSHSDCPESDISTPIKSIMSQFLKPFLTKIKEFFTQLFSDLFKNVSF